MPSRMPFKNGSFVHHTDGAAVVNEDMDKTVFSKRDEADMGMLGKRQQLSRNFGFMSMLGFTTTMMCTWEAVFFSNSTAMLDGGPVALVYGFVFALVGNLLTALSLAEMASMAPISAGQYHWVALLAPPKYSRFLSWITGWIATLGWQATAASAVFFSGTMIQGLLVLNYPSYVPERWQGTLLMWAALLIVVLVNTLGAKLLPKIDGFILIFHTLGFFAIMIPLVYLAPHSSPSFVFGTFIDSGGWNSNGLAWMIGLLSANLPFLGYDGPVHMAEEVQDASTIVPWCMLFTIIINGVLALGTIIAFLFCIGNLDDALTSPTGYDFIYVFYNATQSNAGTCVMTAILITLVTCASFGFLASASRQTWAFARDRGLPFSNILSKVNKRQALPLNAIALSTVVASLICLINVGSTAAFNAIVSLTIAGLFTSYMIPITLLVMKRFKGDEIRWGPWRLGRAGLPINVCALAFLFISTLFSFFPPATPVTAVSMNWSVVVFMGGIIIGLVFYAVRGRKIYTGPIVERPIIVMDSYEG